MKTLIFILCLIVIKAKQFKYIYYDEIQTIFKSLNDTCSDFIKVTNSKEKYNISLPNCGDTECNNLIVYMTDYSTYNIDKPHIYISGLLHGDEILGATSLTELALYFCNPDNRKGWAFDLLKERVFVFTPFTNAYGYYHGIRVNVFKYRRKK
jgi:hypothetical protein